MTVTIYISTIKYTELNKYMKAGYFRKEFPHSVHLVIINISHLCDLNNFKLL